VVRQSKVTASTLPPGSATILDMSESRPPQLPRLQVIPSFEEASGWLLTLSTSVDPTYIDSMGHMNVARYVHLFDLATWDLFARVGIDREYIRTQQAGMFAVEQHLRYLGELRANDPLEIHSRVLDVRERSLTFVEVMTDPARRRVSAVAEVVGVHIDMRTRRSSALPPTIAAALQGLKGEAKTS
jgi:acyl-CoA thioester hydrolase